MKRTTGQKGFSLVEITVALGIMTAAGVALTRLMNNQMKASKTVETRFEYSSILNDIRETLSIKQNCAQTFLGRNGETLAEGNVTSIKQGMIASGGLTTFVDKYQSNTNFSLAPVYGNGAVKILGYSISDVDLDPSIGVPAAGLEGSTHLIIRFAVSGDGKSTTGVKETIRKIKLNVILDTARNIIACSSTGSMSDLDNLYVNYDGDFMVGNLTMGDPTDTSVQAHIIMLNDNEIDFQSDKRLKHEIKDINTLSKIRKLHPVHYKWKSTGTPGYGVIAQELALVYPDLVHKRNDDYLTVNYIQLTPIMLRGIQEVDEENRKLKKEITNLKEMINLMKQDLCRTNPKASSCK